MTGRGPMLLAAALIAVLPDAGCATAVNHPALTAGAVGATLGFSTCKLAKDDYAACGLVGAGAGGFLALVAATALWLGGDGHSVMVEEQAKPLPEDGRPIRRHRKPPVDPDAPPATSPVPLTPAPAAPTTEPPATSPVPLTPAPAAPTTEPPATSPAPATPPS
jgi:hypothetical protein